jgi:hypothetical protein
MVSFGLKIAARSKRQNLVSIFYRYRIHGNCATSWHIHGCGRAQNEHQANDSNMQAAPLHAVLRHPLSTGCCNASFPPSELVYAARARTNATYAPVVRTSRCSSLHIFESLCHVNEPYDTTSPLLLFHFSRKIYQNAHRWFANSRELQFRCLPRNNFDSKHENLNNFRLK